MIDEIRADVIRTGTALLPAAGQAVYDADAEVRRLAIEAIEFTAGALADLILGDTTSTANLPPESRAWTPDERKLVDDFRQNVADERARVMPLVEGLQTQGRALSRTLVDTDLAVRLTGSRTLDEIARAHDKLRAREISIPRQDGIPPKSDDGPSN